MQEKEKITRRKYLKYIGTIVGVAIVGSVGYYLFRSYGPGGARTKVPPEGTPEWKKWKREEIGRPDPDERQGTLHVYAWTGYDAPNVIGPFEKEYSPLKVDVAIMEDSAVTYNQFVGGQYKVYDVVSVDMDWVRAFAKANLIKPLDLDVWKPWTFDNYVDEFKNFRFSFVDTETWEFAKKWGEGTLYGFPMRIWYTGLGVNLEKIPIEEAMTYDICLQPDVRVGIAHRDFPNIWSLLLWARVDPWKEHTDDEIKKVRELAIQLAENAVAIYPSFAAMNMALASGEVDIIFGYDNLTGYALRRDGHYEIDTVVPKEGAVVGTETICLVNNPNLHPAADDIIRYYQSKEGAARLSFPAEGQPCPVPIKGVEEEWTEEQRKIIRMDFAREQMSRCTWFQGVPDMEKFSDIWREMKVRVGKKRKS